MFFVCPSFVVTVLFMCCFVLLAVLFVGVLLCLFDVLRVVTVLCIVVFVLGYVFSVCVCLMLFCLCVLDFPSVGN